MTRESTPSPEPPVESINTTEVRTAAAVHYYQTLECRLRRLAMIPFFSNQRTWLNLVIDPNVIYSICHPDFPKLVDYSEIVDVKPCTEFVNWFRDRKIISDTAITQTRLRVQYKDQKEIFRHTFKIAKTWTEPFVHAIVGNNFFERHTAMIYPEYVTIAKRTFKPIQSSYKVLEVANTGIQYAREKECLVPEYGEKDSSDAIIFPRPPTPPSGRTSTSWGITGKPSRP